MFVAKLWVRIKGEVLALKDDLAQGGDLRDKASQLIEKIEQRLIADTERPLPDRVDSASEASSSRVSPERHAAPPPSVEELERAWQELRRLKDQANPPPPSRESSPGPNPRKLG
jgi:hypothetical protein